MKATGNIGRQGRHSLRNGLLGLVLVAALAGPWQLHSVAAAVKPHDVPPLLSVLYGCAFPNDTQVNFEIDNFSNDEQTGHYQVFPPGASSPVLEGDFDLQPLTDTIVISGTYPSSTVLKVHQLDVANGETADFQQQGVCGPTPTPTPQTTTPVPTATVTATSISPSPTVTATVTPPPPPTPEAPSGILFASGIALIGILAGARLRRRRS